MGRTSARAWSLTAIGAVVGIFASIGEAHALSRRAVRWWVPTDSLVQSVPIYGFGSCQSARAEAFRYAKIVCDSKTFVNPTQPKGVFDIGTQCGSTSGNNDWFNLYNDYRCTNDFPTTPNRGIEAHAYCDGFYTAPQYTAALGYFCDPQDPTPGKYRGCQDGQCGNPVSIGPANKVQYEVDYVGSGPFPLRFVRAYNSRANNHSFAKLGTDWTHNYAMTMAFGGPSGSPSLPPTSIVTVSVDRPDGKTLDWNLIGGVFTADPDVVEKLEKTATGWSLTDAEDNVERYDTDGRLLSITNRAGLTHTLSYATTGSFVGFLEKVTDSFGRTLTFGYSAAGVISSITDPAGGKIAFTQSADQWFNLLTRKDQAGATRTYTYSLDISVVNGLYQIIAETGLVSGAPFASFLYESGTPSTRGTANLTQHWGRDGKHTIAFPSANTRDVTESLNLATSATRTYTFQNIQGVPRYTSITGLACPKCGPQKRTFDAKGNILTATDWNGNLTKYTYDARNLELTRTEGLTSAGVATGVTRTFSTEWHPTFRLAKRVALPRRRVTLAFNGDGTTCGVMADGTTPVPGVVCSVTDEETTDATGALGFGAALTGTSRVIAFTYDQNGQLLTVDGPRGDVPDTTVYTYYADNVTCPGVWPLGCRGQLAAVADALGHLTQYVEYDGHGNPLKVVDPNGAVILYTYDALQRVKTRSLAGLVTTYTYDAAGQLLQVTMPDGAFMAFAYDGAQRLTQTTDNTGSRVVYTYDFAGNRVQEDVFDPASALVRTKKRVFAYLTRTVQELGALNQTTTTVFDPQGNVSTVTDPLGNVTTRTYDPLNRLASVKDALVPAGTTTLAYDGQDHVVGVTDARGQATTYVIDGFGRVTQITSADSGVSTAVYDLADNVIARTDAKGQKTDTVYDALGRPTLAKYADGTQALFAYDDANTNGIGRLTSTTDKSGTRSYGYDALGRLLSETLAPTGATPLTVTNKFDAAGHLVQMTYPSGRVVKYAYDTSGRVNQVIAALGATNVTVADLVKYQPFGPAKSWTTQGGAVLSRTFDQDGRIASFMAGGKTWGITYDLASRITGISDGATDNRTYGYDALGRLVAATTPAGSDTYGYDAVGNRTTHNAQTLTYSATSQRLTQTSAPDPRTYAYDANGSPTGDGTRSYEYDARGRLVRATVGEVSTDYSIGTNGARVAKKVTR